MFCYVWVLIVFRSNKLVVAKRTELGDTVRIETLEIPRYLIDLGDEGGLRRVMNINQSPPSLVKPHLIASGSALITLDNKFILYIRSPFIEPYPNRLQDFSGRLMSGETPLQNAVETLYRELLLFDRRGGSVLMPVLPNVKVNPYYKQVLKNNALLISKFYPEVNPLKIEEVWLLQDFIDKPQMIVFYRNSRAVETSKGYVCYDSLTNTVEITYIFRLPLSSTDLGAVSMEYSSSPVIFVDEVSLTYTSNAFFTPRTFLNIVNRLRRRYHLV